LLQTKINHNFISLLTSFSRCALAVERADPVDAGGSVEADSHGAVVDVDRTVVSGPAIDANAGVAALGVGTGAAVLADVRSQAALVHITFAEFAGKCRRADARVAVDVVHAGGAVLAQITWTVINVLLAVLALEACEMKEKIDD